VHIIALKSIFGNNKKGTAVKIEMKKMGRFHPSSKVVPFPRATASIVFDGKIS
jgi:hypothetical protein